MQKLRVGVVGCGNISAIYLKNCTMLFPEVEVLAVSDRLADRAKARAAEFGVRACGVQEILSDAGIDAILNLTVPLAHAEISRAAIAAGKSVYGEKPLAVTLSEGESLVDLAREKNVTLASAPDTFLGAGIQTCRALIDEGALGNPIGGSAFMVCGGHESWHPDPDFYYKEGGGPVLDMGPYYITALVALLGPVARVHGVAKRTFDERIITSQPKRGSRITVEVATHVSGLLEFSCGATVTIVMSFDGPGGTAHDPIEINGTEGTLRVPDPNTFGGPVRVRRRGAAEWREVPLRSGYAENSRGLGLADMARALRQNTVPRAGGNLALHVLEVMHGMHAAARAGAAYAVRHSCSRPDSMTAPP
jgi:predicted dehydrogenase